MPSRPPSVPALLATLDHPHKAGTERLRAGILALDPRTEEVKWSAPSSGCIRLRAGAMRAGS